MTVTAFVQCAVQGGQKTGGADAEEEGRPGGAARQGGLTTRREEPAHPGGSAARRGWIRGEVGTGRRHQLHLCPRPVHPTGCILRRGPAPQEGGLPGLGDRAGTGGAPGRHGEDSCVEGSAGNQHEAGLLSTEGTHPVLGGSCLQPRPRSGLRLRHIHQSTEPAGSPVLRRGPLEGARGGCGGSRTPAGGARPRVLRVGAEGPTDP